MTLSFLLSGEKSGDEISILSHYRGEIRPAIPLPS
jgi:hypothetical protein